MRHNETGTCEHCHSDMPYHLIHNGFGDAAYAYCDTCGQLCCLSQWYKKIPIKTGFKVHQCITPEIEEFLQPCSCGGHFRAGASPRCPSCRKELSADIAADYIEKNAPGTAKGWRWQRNWTDCYSIIINDQVIYDNWKLG